jgi:hypothetical protein
VSGCPVLTLVPRKESFLHGPHPLGAAVGAFAGAFAGAAVGWSWGPLGAALGALLGALTGGTGGYGFGEAAHPYGGDLLPFGAALEVPLRQSWDQYAHYKGRSLQDVRPEIRPGWDTAGAADRDGR